MYHQLFTPFLRFWRWWVYFSRTYIRAYVYETGLYYLYLTVRAKNYSVLQHCLPFTFTFYSQNFFRCRDMWNYLDVITLLIYLLIVILRIVTIARGVHPYHNRWLEIVNYFYGVNTMLLVLRFSSILELNSVVGPLQLALVRMLIDLLIILVQFVFIIIAFSLAITKCFIAEMSYMTSTTNQTEGVTKYDVWVFYADIEWYRQLGLALYLVTSIPKW